MAPRGGLTGRVVPLGRMISRAVASRVHWRGPVILCHLVTGHCNCSCESCLWRDNDTQDLTQAEVERLYRDARDVGFLMNFMWGGEPLLRPDFPALVRFSHEMGFLTVVNTNAWFLEERLDEIGPYVDVLIVSLDHPSEKHDEIRGRKGLFMRVVRGVYATRTRYPGIKVMFNFLLTKNNKDAIEDSVRLARELGVSFYVCPMEVDLLRSGTLSGVKKHLKASPDEEASAADLLIRLKRQGDKVNNSYLYLESIREGKRPYRCHFPKMVLQVGPEGEIIDCRAWDRPIGSVREQGLKTLYEHPRLKELAGPEGERCNKCNNPNRIDMSYFWDLRLEPLVSVFRMAATR